MALKTKVKVGNITNLSDARYCAGMSVDMLGFKISDVDGQGISPIKFGEIINWISGPEFILELPGGPKDKPSVGIDIKLLELPVSKMFESSLDTNQELIINTDVHEWPAYRKELLNRKNQIKYLLVTDSSKSSVSHLKSITTEMSHDFSVLLGFEIHQVDLEEYLSWPISGFALNGSEETSPGIKDYDHLSGILEKLEVD